VRLQVLAVTQQGDSKQYLIHYDGWNKKYDTWVAGDSLKPMNEETKAEFARAEAAAAAKSESKKRKSEGGDGGAGSGGGGGSGAASKSGAKSRRLDEVCAAARAWRGTLL
jgi:mortality factor 4-like protein 1